MSQPTKTAKLKEENQELKRYCKELEKLAYSDPHTDAYNKRLFDLDFADAKEEFKRKKDSFTVMFLDLDKFKEVNDTYGHTEGDALLVRIVEAIKKNIRKYDRVYRYGGDEFIVIIKTGDMRVIKGIANRILKAIEKTKVTVSIGSGTYTEESEEKIPDFVEYVDRLMYQAKANGRNQVVYG